MNLKPYIEKALGGQLKAAKFDKENSSFDVQMFYSNHMTMTYNWTLVRSVDFENRLIKGKISLVDLAVFINDPEKLFQEAARRGDK